MKIVDDGQESEKRRRRRVEDKGQDRQRRVVNGPKQHCQVCPKNEEKKKKVEEVKVKMKNKM